jgi:hypothetical protein
MRNKAPAWLILLILFSCSSREKENSTLFSLLSSSRTNINFSNHLTETDRFNMIQYLYFNNGAGVAAGDINNDGFVDLYFTGNQVPDKLYLNKGNFEFEDITEKAGVGGAGDWKTGVTMADVNGDGLLDIYVCQVTDYKGLKGANQLFINNGDLTFSEKSKEYGLDFKGFATQAAFFDYDSDGDLDMYLVTHSVHSSRTYGRMDLRFMDDPKAGDRLFRNDQVNGKCIFTDVTRKAGIFSSQIGYGLGVSICDVNNDGFPDIYVSNDFHENDYLYINNTDGTFTEKLTQCMNHTGRSSMGNDAADFNNDGLIDIMVLDMLPDDEKIRQQSGGEDDYELYSIKKQYGYNDQFVRNTLQLNLGGCLFSEIGQFAGISSTDWSWSPLICDLDNDGWKDIFITSGIYRRANDLDYIRFLTGGNRFKPAKDNSDLTDKDLYEKMPLYPNTNYAFRNNGNLTFSNVSTDWGFSEKAFSNGCAYADLDNDGDLDLVVNNINRKAEIYRNNNLSGNQYLSVQLKGNGLNTQATGARVIVYADGLQQTIEKYATRGFMSASSDILHFGLGKAEKVDSLVIQWPDRKCQRAEVTRIDTIITVEYHPDGITCQRPKDLTALFHGTTNDPKDLTGLFQRVTIPGLDYMHHEDPWVDFIRESLTPHSLSAEGPALAVSDVNGDGLTDVFIGGAKGQQSALFVQQKGGVFKQISIPAMTGETGTDCIDALFFDADSDNDQDLYIVRGGNELPAGASAQYDILLINDGKGNFKKSAGLPFISHNGSCVKAGDFDKDGDLDLFVGSRSIPGVYGLSPQQFLLENDKQGKFTDITATRATGLKNAGMVTDAEWIDYDADGDPDLVVCGEWMRIMLFRNDEGSLTDVTSMAGLELTSGWWYGIKAADVDGDGDQDLVAGNLGLNSILRASPQEPVELYLGDYDNNGSLDQVITAWRQGKSYPVAQLDELMGKITGLDKKFATYGEMAGKSISEFFGEDAMKRTFRKSAVMMESSVFINNGDRTFEVRALPAEAQFSVVRDIQVGDFDHDGNKDLILSGNDYVVRPTYGKYDASYGWFLQGKSGGFKALWPSQSGLAIPGDARKTTIIVIKGKRYLLTVVNNGPLQVFRME